MQVFIIMSTSFALPSSDASGNWSSVCVPWMKTRPVASNASISCIHIAVHRSLYAAVGGSAISANGPGVVPSGLGRCCHVSGLRVSMK